MDYLEKAAQALEQAGKRAVGMADSAKAVPLLVAVAAGDAELELISRGKVPVRVAGQLVTLTEPQDSLRVGGWQH